VPVAKGGVGPRVPLVLQPNLLLLLRRSASALDAWWCSEASFTFVNILGDNDVEGKPF
jgi:hypothetical protein